MKKITLIFILIAAFASKSFAYCPIPQWCPSAPLDQNINLGNSITRIDFPTVIGATLVVEWWTDLTRSTPLVTPPPGIIVSGTTSSNNREYQFPVAIYGTPNTAGTYHYTVSNLCGHVALSGTIRVGTPTSITTQPVGQTVCLNDPLALSVTASGTNLAYIWEQSPTSNPADFEPAPGTNNGASYTVNTATAGTFYYRVTVMGFTVVESSIVQVIVSGGAPTIGTVTPTDDRSTPQNTAFNPLLTTTPEPTGMPPISIQWYSNTTASTTGGTNLGSANGAQSNSFTPPNATVNLNGVYYYAVATDGCGRTATTANTSGKHIVVPACTSYAGAMGVEACTGTIGVDPGTVSWGGSINIETHARTISGNGITQVWSGDVSTTGCNKTDFNSSYVDGDCRNAINGFNGHYFSWCYMMRHATTLCPTPWRVPSCQDFVNLDVALGGTGENRNVGSGENGWTGTGTDQKYTGTATGTWGGSFRWTGQTSDFITGTATTTTFYWSATHATVEWGWTLLFEASHVWPQNGVSSHRPNGLALRCVKDN
ncbi:MAG: hypothetical protein FWG79_04160 [Bacteroidales bacterium]|nr:hypothetical protein [Bacteroidales bacterium]